MNISAYIDHSRRHYKLCRLYNIALFSCLSFANPSKAQDIETSLGGPPIIYSRPQNITTDKFLDRRNKSVSRNTKENNKHRREIVDQKNYPKSTDPRVPLNARKAPNSQFAKDVSPAPPPLTASPLAPPRGLRSIGGIGF